MELTSVFHSLKQQFERVSTEQRLLEHILLAGKRELTQQVFTFISEQAHIPLRKIAGPNDYRLGDIAAILTHLQTGSILCIDEIHLLQTTLAPILEPVMRDYLLDMVIGKEPKTKHIRLNLPRFTVIAATSRPTLLSYQVHTLFPIEILIDS